MAFVRRRRRVRKCKMCSMKIDYIDYKNNKILICANSVVLLYNIRTNKKNSYFVKNCHDPYWDLKNKEIKNNKAYFNTDSSIFTSVYCSTCYLKIYLDTNLKEIPESIKSRKVIAVSSDKKNKLILEKARLDKDEKLYIENQYGNQYGFFYSPKINDYTNAFFSDDNKLLIINNWNNSKNFDLNGNLLFEIKEPLHSLFNDYYYSVFNNEVRIYKLNYNYFTKYSYRDEIETDTIMQQDPETGELVAKIISSNNSIYQIKNYNDSLFISVSKYSLRIWNNNGQLINKTKSLEWYFDMKRAKSGKYISIYGDEGMVIYSFPDLKKVFIKKDGIESGVGFQFIENDTALCSFYANDTVYWLDTNFKYIRKKYLGKLSSAKSNNERILQYSNNILIGKDYVDESNAKTKKYYFRIYNFNNNKFDSILINSKSVDNIKFSEIKYYPTEKCYLMTDGNDFNLYKLDLNLDTIWHTKTKSLIENLNNVYFNNDKIYLTNCEIYEYYKEQHSFSEIGSSKSTLKKSSYYHYEVFNSKTGKKITQKDYEVNPDDALQILNVYNDGSKVLLYNGYFHYLDKNDFEILSIKKEAIMKPLYDFTNQHNVIWYDEEAKRLRTMSLIPEDIIRKIRVEKEFGEIPTLSKEEKEKYGLK